MNVHVMPNGHLKWNKRRKHINVKSCVCMQAYWNRLWAAVSSFTEESTPLLRRRPGTAATAGSPSWRRRRKPRSKPYAAWLIQRAWTHHIDRRTYRYFRDLLAFRNAGEPVTMVGPSVG
jgi:hypothetical protein